MGHTDSRSGMMQPSGHSMGHSMDHTVGEEDDSMRDNRGWLEEMDAQLASELDSMMAGPEQTETHQTENAFDPVAAHQVNPPIHPGIPGEINPIPMDVGLEVGVESWAGQYGDIGLLDGGPGLGADLGLIQGDLNDVVAGPSEVTPDAMRGGGATGMQGAGPGGVRWSHAEVQPDSRGTVLRLKLMKS
mmetsp:Transcript_41010/g.49768  ORF Transcript_41010/g.49768 Transcript_41010/m.49768 type:complete len:188 (+) Transcript_41010:55-618(+)